MKRFFRKWYLRCKWFIWGHPQPVGVIPSPFWFRLESLLGGIHISGRIDDNCIAFPVNQSYQAAEWKLQLMFRNDVIFSRPVKLLDLMSGDTAKIYGFVNLIQQAQVMWECVKDMAKKYNALEYKHK